MHWEGGLAVGELTFLQELQRLLVVKTANSGSPKRRSKFASSGPGMRSSRNRWNDSRLRQVDRGRRENRYNWTGLARHLLNRSFEVIHTAGQTGSRLDGQPTIMTRRLDGRRAATRRIDTSNFIPHRPERFPQRSGLSPFLVPQKLYLVASGPSLNFATAAGYTRPNKRSATFFVMKSPLPTTWLWFRQGGKGKDSWLATGRRTRN